jgi:hypothetical protein
VTISVPMLSVAHDDAWPGFMEVHRALVAAGAAPALVPVRRCGPRRRPARPIARAWSGRWSNACCSTRSAAASRSR